MDWSKIKHFNPEVDTMLKSPDTGQCAMNEEFMIRLDIAREIAKVPFVITSGFRTPAHNQKVGGVPNSPHTKGLAVDISAPDSHTYYKIMRALIKEGFTRIGLGSDFIHVDADYEKDQELMWGY